LDLFEKKKGTLNVMVIRIC